MAGERHGNMGTAWERHGMCESALTPYLPGDTNQNLTQIALITFGLSFNVTVTFLGATTWHKQRNYA
jgi:hypothetical protein